MVLFADNGYPLCMGMAANMAAIVAAALLEQSSNTARAGKRVYCMIHVYHGPPARAARHLVRLLSPVWELNGLTVGGGGGEWRSTVESLVEISSSGLLLGLLCFMFIRPGTLYTCLEAEGRGKAKAGRRERAAECESDVASPGRRWIPLARRRASTERAGARVL